MRIKGFLETLKKRKFEDRVWDSNSAFVQSCFVDGKIRLLNEEIGNEKQLPMEHRIRLCKEIPKDLRKKINSRVRTGIEEHLRE